jgi:hypothetical protein
MSTVHNTNEACCSIPPAESNYTPKGTYKGYGGIDKVYVTGDASSKTKLVSVFDIFGCIVRQLAIGQRGANSFLTGSTLRPSRVPTFSQKN